MVPGKKPLKVCILAAGKGTRMNSVTPHLHKALLPIHNKPAILHILDQLPETAEVFVAVGHKADQIKDFFSVLPQHRKVQFVDIPNYDGEGSGPGATLLQCRKQLDSPFLVVCADTLWSENLVWDEKYSTIFVHTSQEEDLSRFCNISFDQNNTVIGVYDKALPPKDHNSQCFTGLVYISNPELYFETLAKSIPIAGEKQICSGLMSLVEKGECRVSSLPTWKDVGTPENYLNLDTEPFSIFKKSTEDLFFVDDLVIKFFDDAQICNERAQRFTVDHDIHPSIVTSGKQFYSFKYTFGDTLKISLTPERFSNFLDYCQEKLWLSREKPKNFKELSIAFYKTKTQQRFESFSHQYPDSESHSRIGAFLKLFDWQKIIANSRASRFHGDLQLDNVIYTGTSFQLIDFRQSYAGYLYCGDIYYDFAKLLTSIIVDFDQLKNRSSQRAAGPIPHHSVYIEQLKNCAQKMDINYHIVESLVPIVLINMMPLHHSDVALKIATTVKERFLQAPNADSFVSEISL